MKFEVLSKSHLKQLLSFELENKLWFDSLIEPRSNSFYTEQGVSDHIDLLMNNMNSGTAYCGVLIHNDVIVARGNLKDIVNKTASVGYRVSKQFISQGFASFCLATLIKVAQEKLGITTIEAYVLDNNPASKHVLKKQGFSIVKSIPNFIVLNDKQLGCTKFSIKYL